MRTRRVRRRKKREPFVVTVPPDFDVEADRRAEYLELTYAYLAGRSRFGQFENADATAARRSERTIDDLLAALRPVVVNR